MSLNKLKNKIKFDNAIVHYRKNVGYFYIKIYNKFKFSQYIINQNTLLTFFCIIQFLYKVGVKIT